MIPFLGNTTTKKNRKNIITREKSKNPITEKTMKIGFLHPTSKDKLVFLIPANLYLNS